MTARVVAPRVLPSPERMLRSLAYLLVRLPLPALGALAVAVPAGVGGVRGLLTIGLPLLIFYLGVAVTASPLARAAVGALGEGPVADPHSHVDEGSVLARLQVRLREAATRREVAHALLGAALAPLDVAAMLLWPVTAVVLLVAPLLIADGPIALGVTDIDTSGEAWPAMVAGLVLLICGGHAVTVLAGLHAREARALLGPRGGEQHRQLVELAHSRLRLIDAFDVERRRIERDLHDGAQQQLVTLAMTLDLVRIELEDDEPKRAARLVDEAHAQVTRTIGELRDLINGIHPPALADRGLPGAIAELVDRTTLPVVERVDLPDRLADSVETAAYFVVAEALTNAIKHSHATRAEVDVHLQGDELAVRVRDDGAGGADASAGSGLAGLGDRVAALGGRLTLSSPLGGPTVLEARIPCRGMP